MQKHEYKARDKTVHKMSRDGLREENLRTKAEKRLTDHEEEEAVEMPKRVPNQGKSIRQNLQEESEREGIEDVDRLELEPLKEKVTKRQKIKVISKHQEKLKKERSDVRDDTDIESQEESELKAGEEETSSSVMRSTPKRMSKQKESICHNLQEESERKETEDVDRLELEPLKEKVTKRQKIKAISKYQEKLKKEQSDVRDDTDIESQEESELKAGEEETSLSVLRSTPKRTSEQKESRRQNLREVRGRESLENVDKKRCYHEHAQVEEISLEEFKEEIKDKVKSERTFKEQKKHKSRLSFEGEKDNKIPGSGMGKKATYVAVGAVTAYGRQRFKENVDDNAGVDAADHAERVGESLARKSMHIRHRYNEKRKRSQLLEEKSVDGELPGRLHFEKETVAGTEQRVQKEAAEKTKASFQKNWQKKQYQKKYQAVKQGKETKETVATQIKRVTDKAKSALRQVIAQNRGLFLTIGVLILLFVLMAVSISSCAGAFQGGLNAVVSTSYSSEDEDIYAVENAYVALENALNQQINQMQERHDDYDEFRFQIDEIGHNPYHLISYLTTKYGGFTYEEVADEIEEIFQEQYGLYTDSTRETVTETRMVRVGESLGNVVTSGYCSCSICCGRWAGGPTASGVYPTPDHTIAVDASDPFVPMGTKVIMNGVEYTVEDTGAFDQYGVQFDVYYGDHSSASAHGHQTWEAFIADDNGSQEVEVTTTKEVNRLDVTLKNNHLDTVLRRRMTDEEEEQYDAYNRFFGNRDYLFDVNRIPTGGGGFGYDIPADALSDPQFANMIQEAEKYLGYPYVWGGASPSTSFDCSGFVCWVINNCGNGWNVGRTTAEGLRSHCAYLSPEEARPGDLIFFEGTYDTPGASHVGIYVGENMMIHCGNPIQYTSISSSYWQQHFMAFGRLS